MPQGASGGLRVPQGASGGLRGPQVASGGLRGPQVASGGLRVPQGASGSLRWPQGISGSLRWPQWVPGDLREPQVASGCLSWLRVAQGSSRWQRVANGSPSDEKTDIVKLHTCQTLQNQCETAPKQTPQCNISKGRHPKSEIQIKICLRWTASPFNMVARKLRKLKIAPPLHPTYGRFLTFFFFF